MSEKTESEGDVWAPAKANLRDTVKWLATIIAAMAATILAGATLTGVAGLSASAQILALASGALGLACVVGIVGIFLRLLTSQTFYFGQLATDPALCQQINNHADDLLPPEYSNIETFVADRRQAISDMRSYAGSKSTQEYIDARTFLDSARTSIANLTSYAHFELLRRNLVRSFKWLVPLSLVGVFSFGAFAVLATPRQADDAKPMQIVLTAGTGWQEVLEAPLALCSQ